MNNETSKGKIIFFYRCELLLRCSFSSTCCVCDFTKCRFQMYQLDGDKHRAWSMIYYHKKLFSIVNWLKTNINSCGIIYIWLSNNKLKFLLFDTPFRQLCRLWSWLRGCRLRKLILADYYRSQWSLKTITSDFTAIRKISVSR